MKEEVTPQAREHSEQSPQRQEVPAVFKQGTRVPVSGGNKQGQRQGRAESWGWGREGQPEDGDKKGQRVLSMIWDGVSP